MDGGGGQRKADKPESVKDVNALLQRESNASFDYIPPQPAVLHGVGNAAPGMVYSSLSGVPGQGMYQMPRMPSEVQLEEEPMYVNAKQYHRILKRRAARAKWDAHMSAAKLKRPYMHESRHRHAMRRPRGPGGRFLTATEIAALKKKEASAKGETATGTKA